MFCVGGRVPSAGRDKLVASSGLEPLSVRLEGAGLAGVNYFFRRSLDEATRPAVIIVAGQLGRIPSARLNWSGLWELNPLAIPKALRSKRSAYAFRHAGIKLVPRSGIELARLSTLDSRSSVCLFTHRGMIGAPTGNRTLIY